VKENINELLEEILERIDETDEFRECLYNPNLPDFCKDVKYFKSSFHKDEDNNQYSVSEEESLSLAQNIYEKWIKSNSVHVDHSLDFEIENMIKQNIVEPTLFDPIFNEKCFLFNN